jgi:AraC family transcriptional regulator
MLRYLALGLRDFGTHPMVPSRRVDWEFYSVLEGRCAPFFTEGEKPRLCTRTLWVLPPENLHGWTGERGRPCKVASFQFAFLPEQLCARARAAGVLAVPISARQARDIESWALELQPHFHEPTSFSDLHYHRVMLQLSLIALHAGPAAQAHPYHKLAQEKVVAAERWYAEHLPESPAVKQVADAVHVSPSHLRRLFREVKHEGPKALLKRVQMERVVRQLSLTSDGLEKIAADCGFASASELCRAFKARFRLPPAVWRKNLTPPYQEPKAKRGEAAKTRPDSPVHRRLGKYVRFTER